MVPQAFSLSIISRGWRDEQATLHVKPPHGMRKRLWHMYLVLMEARINTAGVCILLGLYPVAFFLKYGMMEDPDTPVVEDRQLALLFDFFFPRGNHTVLMFLALLAQELLQDELMMSMYVYLFGAQSMNFGRYIGHWWHYNTMRSMLIWYHYSAPVIGLNVAGVGVRLQIEGKLASASP